MRMLRFATGETILLPFGIYEDEKSGKEASDFAMKQLGEMLRVAVVCKQSQTPDGTVHAERLMGLGEFLGALGIKDVGHMTKMHDVQSASGIVVAAPKLILPTRH